MGLTFGKRLDDVTSDPDALSDLLAAAGGGGAPAPESDGGPLDADPDPGWEEPTIGERFAQVKGVSSGAPRKVTAAVRKDVRAKTALLLGMGATAWEARDPHCGGALAQAVPDVSDALAEILCDSPDIVRWFTSGSGYMKWLNLAAALQPVARTMVAHHITHSIADDGPDAMDFQAYAAA